MNASAGSAVQVLVNDACATGTSSEAWASSIASIIDHLNGGQATVLQIVQALQDWLTSGEDSRRAQGTRLLADVVSSGSESLAPGDVHHLAEFLAARLLDWPCTEYAALGCTALLQRYMRPQPVGEAGEGRGPPRSTLAESDALLVVRTAATGMAPQVQALAQPQRSACLRLLNVAIQVWGPAVLRATQAAGGGEFVGCVNLLEAAIAAVDGEKDPRCLLASFQLLQTAVKVYHAPGVSSAQLSAQAEEVVEVLSCYFPVSFTPPKNDPYRITRNDLAQGLEACMAASPFLACWVMPLVLEKLSSTYRPAKEDALSALVTCCCSYGIDALQPHLPAIWSALRNEMVVAPSAFGVVGGEELQTKRALAARAAACLSRIMTSVPQAVATLQALAVNDVCVQDLVGVIDGSSNRAEAHKGSDPDRPDRIVLCTADLLGTVCGGSVAACQHVLSVFMPRILSILSSITNKPIPSSNKSASSLDPVTLSSSNSWASTKVVHCLAVVRGVLRGITDGLQAQDPHASAAAPAGPSSAQDSSSGVQKQQQPQQQQRFQELCMAYVAALTPDFVGATVGATLEALEAVELACLGMAMQVEAADEIDTSVSAAAAPQVLLACTAVWQELLRLNSLTQPTLSPQAHAPACLLTREQLTQGVHVLTRWALVAGAGAGATAGETLQQDAGEELVLPEGVVTPVPCHVAWKAPQAGHLESLAALQQALQTVEAQHGAAQQAGTAVQQHVLQQLCAALLGPALKQAWADPAAAPPPAAAPAPAPTGSTGCAQAALPQTPPTRQPVRARALHVTASLAACSPSLALALHARLAPLLLQLLARQAEAPDSAGAPAAWAPVTQEVLLLLGQQLPPAWPRPLPQHHAAALSAFVDALLELPLDAALLHPAAAAASQSAAAGAAVDQQPNGPTGAAAAAVAAAVERALAAACASCGGLTACLDAEEQRGVAMTACAAVAHAHGMLQSLAVAAAALAAVAVGAHAPRAQPDPQLSGQQAGGAAGTASAASLARACAACAALGGLQPEVLAGAESVLQLVDALCDLATWQPPPLTAPVAPHSGMEPQGAAVACSPSAVHVARVMHRAAAVALASVVDKWPGEAEELKGLACRVLGRWGLLRCVLTAEATTTGPASTGAPAPDSSSWHALAWLARALAMRGSPVAPAIVDFVVGCLLDLTWAPASAASGAGEAGQEAMAVDGGPDDACAGTAIGQQGAGSGSSSAALAAAGAAFFGILLGGAGEGVWHHACTRVLWQQRALAQCLGPLRGALERMPPPPLHSSVQGGSGTASGVSPRLTLLLALCSLLSSVPLSMLQHDVPRLVLPLLAALRELPALADACAPQQQHLEQQAQVQAQEVPQLQGVAELEGQLNACVEGALRVLEQLLLRNERLRPLLEEHVEQLIFCLALLMGYKGWPAVREAALRCAMLLMELPYHLLHPHRLVVIKAVTKALDDDKRSVRGLAVRCRRIWVPK